MRLSIGRSFLFSSLGVACAVALWPAGAHAASTPVTYCGEELTQPGDYHLEADLGPCSGHGVVITGSDVRLTLAGHTLSGLSDATACQPQIGIDIRNSASNARVGGGTVTGFESGVSLTGGARASALRVLDNCGFGILVAGEGVRVDTSVVSGSVDGIAICNAKQALVTSNEVFGNSRYGVLVSCGLGQDDDNHVVQNILHDNGMPTTGDGGGVGVFSGNRLRIAGNNVTGNFAGINVMTSASATIEDNTVNTNATNGIVLGAGALDTSVLDNAAFLNGLVDMQDDADACGSNTWTANRFVSDLVAGLPNGGPDVPCLQ
jgi:parallel beta-helix repeat protein